MNSLGRIALGLTFSVTCQSYPVTISQLIQRQQAAAMAWHDRMFSLPSRNSLTTMSDAELSQVLDDQMGRMILLSGVGIISAACFCGAAGSIFSTKGFGFAGKSILQWCKGSTCALGKRACLSCSMPVTGLIVYKCVPAIYQKWCFIGYIKKLQRERAQERTAKRDFEQRQAHEREVKEKLDKAQKELEHIRREQEKLQAATAEVLKRQRDLMREQRENFRDMGQALQQESEGIRAQLSFQAEQNRQTQEVVALLAWHMQKAGHIPNSPPTQQHNRLEFSKRRLHRNRMLLQR
jgi:hypothetical protein